LPPAREGGLRNAAAVASCERKGMKTLGKRLENRVAFITGAGRNIGSAIALQFAEEGADVVINVRADRQQADDLVRRITALNRKAVVVVGDVTDPEAVDRMVQTALDEFGRIDILVNNAAIRPSKPFLEMEIEEWNHVIDVNLNGPFLCCRKILPSMVRQKYGKIVNIVGWTAFRGWKDRAHVIAAKAGLHGLTRALALDFADYYINVNTVAFGYIDTRRNMEWYRGNWPSEEEWKRRIPLGRPGSMEEAAKTVAFLASDDSSYITGQVIHANGGALIY